MVLTLEKTAKGDNGGISDQEGKRGRNRSFTWEGPQRKQSECGNAPLLFCSIFVLPSAKRRAGKSGPEQ